MAYLTLKFTVKYVLSYVKIRWKNMLCLTLKFADKICFIIHYNSPICFGRFCDHHQRTLQEYWYNIANVSFTYFYNNIIQYCMTKGTAWHRHCIILLKQFGQLLYVTGVPVKRLDDSRKSDRNTQRWFLMYDKTYFIRMHLLVYSISVNAIPRFAWMYWGRLRNILLSFMLQWPCIVRSSKIKPTRCRCNLKFISWLIEPQHVSGIITPIIRRTILSMTACGVCLVVLAVVVWSWDAD